MKEETNGNQIKTMKTEELNQLNGGKMQPFPTNTDTDRRSSSDDHDNSLNDHDSSSIYIHENLKQSLHPELLDMENRRIDPATRLIFPDCEGKARNVICGSGSHFHFWNDGHNYSQILLYVWDCLWTILSGRDIVLQNFQNLGTYVITRAQATQAQVNK